MGWRCDDIHIITDMWFKLFDVQQLCPGNCCIGGLGEDGGLTITPVTNEGDGDGDGDYDVDGE